MPKEFSIDYLLGQADFSKKARVKLEGQQLWRRFHALGTEMIVTKSGRFGRLFYDV